jgi:hypothetical protein
MGRLKQQVKLFISINPVISNQNININSSNNRDINSIFSSPSTSSSSSSLITSTNIQKNNKQVSMLLLPQLLELFQLLTDISGDFLVMKFKDDMWPLLSEILVHNLDIEMIILQNKRLASKNKFKNNKDNMISNIINNKQNIVSDNQKDNNLYHDINKFSIDTKIKTSILKFIISISNNKACFNFIRSIISPLIWLSLPLLLSHQSDIVKDYTNQLIIILMKIDPSLIISFAGSITDNIYLDNEFGYEINSSDRDRDRYKGNFTNEFWSAITSIPSIVEIMNKNTTSTSTVQFHSVSGGDRILANYRSDSGFIDTLKSFITPISSNTTSTTNTTSTSAAGVPDMYDSCLFDSYWIDNELPRWSQI